jgi:AAA15 family ATPase/GTPase
VFARAARVRIPPSPPALLKGVFMFNKLTIKNFRGIEKLEINEFNKINIFVGENGIGKTTILDAIYVSINPNNAHLAFKTNIFRGIDETLNNADFWKTFFWNFEEKNEIQISLSNKNKINKRSIEIAPFYTSKKITLKAEEKTIQEQGLLPAKPPFEEENVLGLINKFKIGNEVREFKSIISQSDINSLEMRKDNSYTELLNGSYLNNSTFLDNNSIALKLDNVVNRKKTASLIQLLQKFKVSINDIRTVKNKIKIDDSDFSDLVYAHTYGDGFVRALHILCTFISDDSNIVLIDEIENGLHTFSQRCVWESISNLLDIQKETQLFATTHSYDMIKNLFKVFKKNKKENLLSVYRMQKDNNNNNLKLIHYNAKELQYAIEQDQDIR